MAMCIWAFPLGEETSGHKQRIENRLEELAQRFRERGPMLFGAWQPRLHSRSTWPRNRGGLGGQTGARHRAGISRRGTRLSRRRECRIEHGCRIVLDDQIRAQLNDKLYVR